VEIQKQDSHFPTATSLSLSNQSKMKGDQPQPKTLSFRLISGLEYAVGHRIFSNFSFAAALATRLAPENRES
jgi:hypothetical protein